MKSECTLYTVKIEILETKIGLTDAWRSRQWRVQEGGWTPDGRAVASGDCQSPGSCPARQWQPRGRLTDFVNAKTLVCIFNRRGHHCQILNVVCKSSHIIGVFQIIFCEYNLKILLLNIILLICMGWILVSLNLIDGLRRLKINAL